MIRTYQLILIFIPALLIVGAAFYIRAAQYEPLYPDIQQQQTNDTAPRTQFVPIFPDDPILGNPDAPNTIITFEDMGCERCQQQMGIFQELVAKHPNDVRVVWKGLTVTEFPVSSETAHLYGYCAGKVGKFAAFANLAFAGTHTLSHANLQQMAEEAQIEPTSISSCIADGSATQYLAKVEALAQNIGLHSVPASFVNNQQIEGIQTVAGWEGVLNL